jgi:hypothetical protein
LKPVREAILDGPSIDALFPTKLSAVGGPVIVDVIEFKEVWFRFVAVGTPAAIPFYELLSPFAQWHARWPPGFCDMAVATE